MSVFGPFLVINPSMKLQENFEIFINFPCELDKRFYCQNLPSNGIYSMFPPFSLFSGNKAPDNLLHLDNAGSNL